MLGEAGIRTGALTTAELEAIVQQAHDLTGSLKQAILEHFLEPGPAVDNADVRLAAEVVQAVAAWFVFEARMCWSLMEEGCGELRVNRDLADVRAQIAALKQLGNLLRPMTF